MTRRERHLRHTFRVLTLNVTPVDAVLFASDIAAVGSFRCPATHPLFFDSGPIGNPLFVFPRTVVSIRYDDGTSFLGDPNTVALYNRNQLYTREKVSDCDASDWYAVADDVLLDAIAAYDPYVFDRPEEPFSMTHVPGRTSLYLEQRQLFEQLLTESAADRLVVEEAIIGLLDGVLRQIYGGAVRRSRNDMHDRVEAARLAVAGDISRNISLRELAKRADCSPFALCRAFPAFTGTTFTEYRQSLRLRSALDLLRSNVDLTTIALDLGYSSHSHFTMAFRKAFGLTPSDFRSRRGPVFRPVPHRLQRSA